MSRPGVMRPQIGWVIVAYDDNCFAITTCHAKQADPLESGSAEDNICGKPYDSPFQIHPNRYV